MSDYSHVLTVKFKPNGETEVELKSANGGPVIAARSIVTEITESKRSGIIRWSEMAGTAVAAFAKQFWPF
jgi:hypothetical protein